MNKMPQIKRCIIFFTNILDFKKTYNDIREVVAKLNCLTLNRYYK